MSRPRAWRSDPSKRAWGLLTPALPTAGSGSGRAATVQAHQRPTGHRPHAGTAGRHSDAPRSIIDWFQAQASPAGSAASAAACAALGDNRPPSARASTRATLVSTTAASASKAKASTARAVYAPIPGRASRSVNVGGHRPLEALDHHPCRGVEVDGAPRVAESLPFTQHVAERRTGTRGDGREALQERSPPRHHPQRLRLLQHHLRHQHRPRVAGVAPGQVAQPRHAPGEERLLRDGIGEAHSPQTSMPSYGRRRCGAAARFHTMTLRRK